jgi:hypothetical protein
LHLAERATAYASFAQGGSLSTHVWGRFCAREEDAQFDFLSGYHGLKFTHLRHANLSTSLDLNEEAAGVVRRVEEPHFAVNTGVAAFLAVIP